MPKQSEKIINSPDSIFFMQLRYHMSNLLSIALRSTNIKAARDRIMVSWWLRCFSNYFQGFCFQFYLNKKMSLKTSQVLIKSITFPSVSSKEKKTSLAVQTYVFRQIYKVFMYSSFDPMDKCWILGLIP